MCPKSYIPRKQSNLKSEIINLRVHEAGSSLASSGPQSILPSQYSELRMHFPLAQLNSEMRHTLRLPRLAPGLKE